MSVRWDDLRVLLAVARTGRLSAAAEQLGVTHPTVGRRLRSLETALGTRLADRTPSGVTLTAAGVELLQVAERMEWELQDAELRLMGQDAELSGPLTVSLFDFLMWACAPAVADFIRLHPNVELSLLADLEPVSLPQREADVAMRLTDQPPDTLVGRRIGTLGFAVYAARTLVDTAGTELSALPWISYVGAEGAWLEEWITANAGGARVVLRINQNALLRRQAVCAGIGAHFLPTYEGDALPELVQLSPVHFTRGLWLLSHRELRGNQRVRAFVQHMDAALRPMAVRS